jgi:hypothetical protein
MEYPMQAPMQIVLPAYNGAKPWRPWASGILTLSVRSGRRAAQKRPLRIVSKAGSAPAAQHLDRDEDGAPGYGREL